MQSEQPNGPEKTGIKRETEKLSGSMCGGGRDVLKWMKQKLPLRVPLPHCSCGLVNFQPPRCNGWPQLPHYPLASFCSPRCNGWALRVQLPHPQRMCRCPLASFCSPVHSQPPRCNGWQLWCACRSSPLYISSSPQSALCPPNTPCHFSQVVFHPPCLWGG
jgi:hypothetical protein